MAKKKHIAVLMVIIIVFCFSPINADSKKNTTIIKKEYYNNGNVKSITPYINGKKVGVEKIFYDNGTLAKEIEYKNDLKDGMENSYSPKGILEFIIHYRKGKKHGTEKSFFESGEVQSSVNFVNGKKEGVEIWYYDSGQIRILESYKNGKQEGYRKIFYPFGFRHIAFYKNGKLFGKEVEYDNCGNILKKIIHDGKGNSEVIIDRNYLALKKQIQLKGKTSIIDHKYLIFVKNTNIIVILNLDNPGKTIFKKHFNFEITDIEGCPNYPYVNIESYSKEMRSFVDYIYDIEADRIYEPIKHVKFELDEKRWSENGELTFINNHHSILVIKTKDLIDYLNKKNVSEVLRINGPADGDIWQIKWIGTYLIYAASTVCCWEECWGLYDLKRNKNYFLSCCGMKYFFTSCDDFQVPKIISDVFLPYIEEGKLVEISNDFQKEVLRITKDKKWEIE